MGNEWEMGNVLYFFIEVDLWLILFFKGENSGGMGCVPIPVIFIYCWVYAFRPALALSGRLDTRW